MSIASGLIIELENTYRFFKSTVSIFSEEDSAYKPQPEMMTVSSQVAHVADSVDWFIEGAFGKGWDMDFEGLLAKVNEVTSFTEAMEWLDRSFEAAKKVIADASDEDLMATIPYPEIMPGAPRLAVVSGIVDHTAHHRGALTVYARGLGKVSPMPYVDP